MRALSILWQHWREDPLITEATEANQSVFAIELNKCRSPSLTDNYERLCRFREAWNERDQNFETQISDIHRGHFSNALMNIKHSVVGIGGVMATLVVAANIFKQLPILLYGAVYSPYAAAAVLGISVLNVARALASREPKARQALHDQLLQQQTVLDNNIRALEDAHAPQLLELRTAPFIDDCVQTRLSALFQREAEKQHRLQITKDEDIERFHLGVDNPVTIKKGRLTLTARKDK